MSPTTAGYGERFYDNVRVTARSSADRIAPMIMSLVRPASVVDVGCGSGTWLSVFRSLGVESILGLDAAFVDRASLEIPAEDFVVVDLAQPVPIRRRFDLALCLEVGEHLPATSADTLVDGLTKLSDAVLFSAAIPGQGGTNHINEQWPPYWARKFASLGFEPIDALRSRIWADPLVAFWYAQNTVLYCSTERISRSTTLRSEADRGAGSVLSLVHPELYHLQGAPGVRIALRSLARAFGRAIAKHSGRGSTDEAGRWR